MPLKRPWYANDHNLCISIYIGTYIRIREQRSDLYCCYIQTLAELLFLPVYVMLTKFYRICALTWTHDEHTSISRFIFCPGCAYRIELWFSICNGAHSAVLCIYNAPANWNCLMSICIWYAVLDLCSLYKWASVVYLWLIGINIILLHTIKHRYLDDVHAGALCAIIFTACARFVVKFHMIACAKTK